MLQVQLSLERQKRVIMEEEYGFVLKENSELEQQLGVTDVYRVRALELEVEVVEMRQMLQSEYFFVNGVEKLVLDFLFVFFKEFSQSLLEEMFLIVLEVQRKFFKRSSSEIVLSSLVGGDIVKGYEEICIRRVKVVKQRGIFFLYEVDIQYSVLKVKYEELLKKCQQEEDFLFYKVVQIFRVLVKDSVGVNVQFEFSVRSWELVFFILEFIGFFIIIIFLEYKVFFKEIFSCIKKIKQEIDEQRTKYRFFFFYF